MTQVVLVRQIASQPWCLLLWRISNESKARPRRATARRAPERSRARTPLAIEMPPRAARTGAEASQRNRGP